MEFSYSEKTDTMFFKFNAEVIILIQEDSELNMGDEDNVEFFQPNVGDEDNVEFFQPNMADNQNKKYLIVFAILIAFMLRYVFGFLIWRSPLIWYNKLSL